VFFVTNGVQIFGMQLHTNIFNYLTLHVYISYKPTRVCDKQWPRVVYLYIHGWPSPWDSPSIIPSHTARSGHQQEGENVM
jgi:hypothetical protein